MLSVVLLSGPITTIMLSIIMLNVVILSDTNAIKTIYVECRSAKRHYAECQGSYTHKVF
jgi:hypothetical protein